MSNKDFSIERRIVKLLRQLETIQDPDKREGIDDVLDTLIEEPLFAGNDAVLVAALERAARQGGSALARNLSERIEALSTIRIVQLVPQTKRRGRAKIDPATEFGELALYALPVVTVTQGGLLASSRHLQKGAHHDALIRSFFEHGLVSESTRLSVEPYLYHWRELDLPGFSKVHQLSMALASEETDDVACARTGWPAIDISQEGPHVELRFLLVTTLTPLSEPNPPFIADFPETDDEAQLDAAMDAFETRSIAWNTQAGELIAQWIGIEQAMVDVPDEFFEGMRKGWSLHMDFSLDFRIYSTLQEFYLFARECDVAASLHEDENGRQLRVGLFNAHEHHFIEGLIRRVAPFEETALLFDDLDARLGTLGFNSVTIMDEVHPDIRCEGCEAPLFQSPWGDLIHPGGNENQEEDGDLEEAEMGEDEEQAPGHVDVLTGNSDTEMLRVANLLEGKTVH